MTRRTLLFACSLMIGMGGSFGCDSGGVFAFGPFGLFVAQNPPAAQPSDGNQNGNDDETGVLPVPADTAVRIWTEPDGSTSLSICRWDSQLHAFDCDPPLSVLLAQKGLHLDELTFDVDSLGTVRCTSGVGATNVGNLPEAVCASATASLTDAEGHTFFMHWPSNCR